VCENFGMRMLLQGKAYTHMHTHRHIHTHQLHTCLLVRNVEHELIRGVTDRHATNRLYRDNKKIV
jgi:hypothetical protein